MSKVMEDKTFFFKIEGKIKAPEEFNAYDTLYELLKHHCAFKITLEEERARAQK